MDNLTRTACAALLALGLPGLAAAFDSGSDASDGDLTPSVNVEIPLPEDGILQYGTVNIPAGVTVTFGRNITNTPVTMLVQGDVTIAGTIDLSGEIGADSGTAGDGLLGDDGLAGRGGPGGFDGGSGGAVTNQSGGGGLGPGGAPSVDTAHGYGGAHATAGSFNAATYGSPTLLPLIGGSGGAGGRGGTNFRGAGGGGGGGAILIAASGTVTLTSPGGIVANGALAGRIAGSGVGFCGGPGSGGGIRIVATNIAGNGVLAANGGFRNCVNYVGGSGRIRLEAETTFTYVGSSSPAFVFSAPNDLFVTGLPTLRISSVAGEAAPNPPTGVADIVLPEGTPNPVAVGIEATNVLLGNTVTVTAIPASGPSTEATSNALDGTLAQSTASADLSLPTGPSTLLATLSFTVVADIGDGLSNLAGGERVRSVELVASVTGPPQTTLATVSGRRVTLRN